MDPAAETAIEQLITAGSYAEAREALEQGIAAAPYDWTMHARLGYVHHACGEHANAVRRYAEAAWILVIQAVARGGGDPGESFEEVVTGPGVLLPMVRPACFDAARALLGRTLDYAKIRTETGLSLLELGDVPNARRAFCEAVEFLPAGSDYDEPWLWLTRIEDM